MENSRIILRSPAHINFINRFDEIIYDLLFNLAVDGSNYIPYVDVDQLHIGILGVDVQNIAHTYGITLSRQVELQLNKAANKDRLRVQFLMREFLSRFPEMLGLLCNITTTASISIRNAEYVVRERSSTKNFIKIKSVIDSINRKLWTRDKDVNERQSGVSTLGTISETLLDTALKRLVDNKNFFKVNNNQVQSYGDFVLMCLPNNLWLSVKSNFARERLLASGYSNDILGVGFFEDPTEFTSRVRIRNFQKAGFLAMYCPDVGVTEDQIRRGSSTYHDIVNFHIDPGTAMPLNINGNQFIRPLSGLYQDINNLMKEKDVRRRFTVTF